MSAAQNEWTSPPSTMVSRTGDAATSSSSLMASAFVQSREVTKRGSNFGNSIPLFKFGFAFA